MYVELRKTHKKSKAMELIGRQYGVSRKTVYAELFPGYKEKQKKLKCNKWSYEKKHPERREKIVAYKRRYQNLRNHIDDAVREALTGSDQPMTMDEISDAILEQNSISMAPATICGLVAKYEFKYGTQLLHELPTQPPSYVLAPGYGRK